MGAGGQEPGLLGKLPWGYVPAALPRAKVFLCPLEARDVGVRRPELRGHSPTPSVPAGAVLVSGLYDLEPILHTYVNDALNMSW